MSLTKVVTGMAAIAVALSAAAPAAAKVQEWTSPNWAGYVFASSNGKYNRISATVKVPSIWWQKGTFVYDPPETTFSRLS